MTAAASMAQVNVRMSPELKAAGEAAMAARGLTPTEVLRWVYQTFADGRDGISQLIRMGSATPTEEDVPSPDDNGALFLQGIDARYESFSHSLGLNLEALGGLPDLTYDELDRLYFDERDHDRGLGDYAE